jgi:ABC transporter substrate binding protein (PQQ-dependent alcohol dehydrogenase system)
MIFLAVWQPAVAAPPGTDTNGIANLTIGYISQTSAVAPPPSPPNAPSADDGFDGAVQGIADDNTTGQFVGQHFDLKDRRLPVGGDAEVAFRQLVREGSHLILAALPAATLLALADLPEAKDVVLFNVQATDDDLRGATCRPNVLHTAPSRAMLADALVQYLILKKWETVFLVTGPTEADRAFAAAIKRSIAKFRAHLVAEKAWTYEPGAKRTDSGHYAVAAQVAEFTQGVPHYDILIVADEDDQFGDTLSYATVEPRPVAGTQGLIPSAWSQPHQEWGAIQLQNRFLGRFGRPMTDRDYAAWLAVRAIGEAATRTGTTDLRQIGDYLRGDQFQLPGYKGEPLSFRPWDGQMRQAVLLSDSHALVSVSPQSGFMHPVTDLDTLGMDRPESRCNVR